MINRKPTVVTEPREARHELRELGLTPEIIQGIAKAASAARTDSLPVDPCSAPGTQAYIHGVRSIRLQLLPLGWRMSRAGNVESTVNDELGIQLCFQNVDQACREKDPEAISGKGSGSRKLIHDGRQTELFVKNETTNTKNFGSTPTVWVVCVSTDAKNVCAEVSCPHTFEGEQFDGFSKRIFIVDEAIDPNPGKANKPDDGDDEADYEVRISKK